MSHSSPTTDFADLVEQIHLWAAEFGFQQVGIAEANMQSETERLEQWINNGYHADMQWIEEHKNLRLAPEKLHPGTLRVISFRINYLPENTEQIKVLKSPEKAYISRYALGRDYHKLIRKRLAKLGEKIAEYCQQNQLFEHTDYRPFVDSAPVLERPLAHNAGLGWIGKHTLLINKTEGSWFFLGEIFTNIPLPVSNTRPKDECGTCEACLKVCPTDAFPEPYVLDARRCISYLTIENKGSIPEEFREPIGNRVFGCDDCQAICPWNKYAKHTNESDFHPRHQLENNDLVHLFRWDEKTFLDKTAGSPIRRIGYENWLRNLAVGLGNAPSRVDIIEALKSRQESASAMVREHIDWAIAQQQDPSRKRKRKIKAD